MDSKLPVYAVILAGGQGTRLWPISRRSHPKQFLDLTGSGSSMLQETVRRAIELTGSILQVLVVAGREQEDWVREQLPDLPLHNLLLEPVGRSTAPSLGLAAWYLSSLSGMSEDAVMLSLPVDHVIKTEKPWFQSVRTAILAAAREDSLVAIGILPDTPATGYGYQHLGEKLDVKTPLPVHRVKKFIEKPSRQVAQDYLDSGEYLWNTGTYAWRISIFLEALKGHVPSLFAGLESLAYPPVLEELEQVYPSFEKISIDHAVLESSSNLLTVRADFERIDVGSLLSLAEIWDSDEEGNTGIGQFLSLESSGNIVYNQDGLVTLLGVDDLVVVRTSSAILVCPRDRLHEVKALLGNLDKKGLEEYQ
ncbi:mannose-1-phosphate guanylyltransferase [Chloroflexota bacterium]